jgi:pimeloyl-ACP methyl ester carboxylesterase
MVSGVRGYRSGEFVYQDFLYDDRALTYPSDPQNAGNAADLVEVRLKLLRDGVGVRLTYNSMKQPDLVAATIALGDSAVATPIPHGAGASSRGEVFVTVHGCQGDAVRASDGHGLGSVRVATDLRRRQVDVVIPYRAYDPRERSAMVVRAAAGLWDSSSNSYVRPDITKPAFFNVAFRSPGPYTGNSWQDETQKAALSAGDISPLSATVSIAALRSGRQDDLVGLPGGLPVTGAMNRILVSHFEPQQGRGDATAGNNDGPCEAPKCTYTYSGRLQPYTVVVPDGPRPRGGYPLTVSLHGSGENHNANENGVLEMLANAGRPTVVVAPSGRGPSFWWYGLGEADVFEAWADAAARYRLDPRSVVMSGQSMGGFGAYKIASTYPDLFLAAFPSVGPGAPTADVVPGSSPVVPRERDIWKNFASLRHVPVLSVNAVADPIVPMTTTTNNMTVLDDLGYRYDFYFFAESSHSDHRIRVPRQYIALGQRGTINLDPRRVTYVVNSAEHDPSHGLSGDHAYWISDLTLADGSSRLGTIDVVSGSRAVGEPQSGQQERSVGRESETFVNYLRQWGTAPKAQPRDALTITASNIASLTIDVDRAGVSCHPKLSITSDYPIRVRLIGMRC